MEVGVLYQEQGACTLLLAICFVVSSLFVFLTCPLFGTRNYRDLEK